MTETMLDRLVGVLMATDGWRPYWSEAEARRVVRALLEELREPTGVMIDAGNRALVLRTGMAGGWRVMIEAILEGKA